VVIARVNKLALLVSLVKRHAPMCDVQHTGNSLPAAKDAPRGSFKWLFINILSLVDPYHGDHLQSMIVRHGPRVRAVRRAARRQITRLLTLILLWVLAASHSAIAQDVATQENAQQSRFVRTVLTLQDSSPELRSEFAATALSHLAGAYAAETRLARRSDQGARMRAWSATVEQYASQLQLLLDDVELGLPVNLTLEGDESLAIAVGDRTVIVSHPRLSQQGALEQGILKDFCARQDCGDIQPDPRSQEPISASYAYIRPNWNFTERGTDCSHHGITVHFRSDQSTTHARVICEQFLQEVLLLADELAAQQRHAVEVQWGQLEIQSSPDRPEHTVRLNALGDSILATVPLLQSTPGLLQQVLPWLRQRLENSPQVTIEIDAASYGWQEP
jgi:hypothetical protein